MKTICIAALAIVMVLSLDIIPVMQTSEHLAKNNEMKALIVFHPDYHKEASYILPAYESVLQEEGVPYISINVFELVTTSADEIVKTVPVIILPDGILQSVPSQFSEWIKEYLSKGGNVAVIYDAGIKHQKGYFLDRCAFADIVGLNYITYGTAAEEAFSHASIQFSSEANRDFFQIPLGKTVDRLVLSGYGYGQLLYPVAKTQPVRSLAESDIYAYGITPEQERFPAIVLTDYLKGKVLYVDLPLGHLKANADDLPLRSIIRTFFFDVVGIPHLMNVEGGIGGIVINWHVDSAVEHNTLPAMKKMNLLREGISCSFHVTAGDFLDYPGDNEGFDAEGKGKELVALIEKYGTIGSHGGWAHNWFAENIENGVFKENEIREYIKRNNESLERITGHKITEYSAPNGVHPQPLTTQILADMGVIAYYYTGDTGSAPNRTFYDGKMISDKIIAFPVMPFEKRASLWEMRALDNKRESEVTEWLFSIPEYAARNRAIRLVYSHPYNIAEYPHAVQQFLDKVEQMQGDKQIVVRSMSDFSRFFLRVLNTRYAFNLEKGKMVVSLKNSEGLSGICIAMPKEKYRRPSGEGIAVQEDGRYYYLTVVGENENEKYITLDKL